MFYKCDTKAQDRQPCPLTCQDMANEDRAECVTLSALVECQSGCFCPPGKVELNETNQGIKCIAMDDCPCYHENIVSFNR